MIQILTAFKTILILKVLRKQPKFNWHLSNLVAFMSINLFVKIKLQKWFDNPLNEIDKTYKITHKEVFLKTKEI